jgi:3-deoxy-D-manno-octulosonic-acid transferase
MYFFYSLVLALVSCAAYPFFALRRVRPRYRIASDLLERLAFSIPPVEEGGVWFIMSSVGEVQAAVPLIRKLHRRRPEIPVSVSAFTPQGVVHARSLFDKTAAVFSPPLDFGFAVRHMLATLNPRLVVLVEGELWPRFLHEAGKRRIPVVLVSGRITQKAFSRWQRLRFLARRVWGALGLACMQSQTEASYARFLGAPRAEACGNLKFDAVLSESRTDAVERLQKMAAGRPVWIAGSLRAGEEPLVFEAWRQVKAKHPNLFFAAVPRHPDKSERSVAEFRGEAPLLRWSELSNQDARPCDVLWVDVIGLLASFYKAADVVFVGGSLLPLGGQNPIEPALCGKPVLMGPFMQNFAAAAEALLKTGGAQTVGNADALAEAVLSLLADEKKRAGMGENARLAMEKHRGAVERSFAMIEPYLKDETAYGR